MQEFLIIVQVGILIYAIFGFISNQNEKARVKEQQAKLLSTRRDADLSDEERSAISEILDCEVTSSEVYYISEHFEAHAIPAEDEGGEDMYLFALANYLIMMPDQALSYLDIEATFAEVVLVDEVMVVIRLNDYYIVDHVNDTLAEPPAQEPNDDLSPSLATAEQAAAEQVTNQASTNAQDEFKQEHLTTEAIISEAKTPRDTAPRSTHRTPEPVPQTVLKSERPATLTEARYLSSPFYNVLVPILLVVAAAIFSHVTKLDLAIEPVWLNAAILITVCIITLLLLKRTGPTPEPTTMVVNRYFGKIEAIDTTGNKTWIVFIAPNGEASKAWFPSQWQNTVSLNRDVQFEVEQSQSAVTRIGLNEISAQDAIKKKPQYLAAAMGLLLGSFFIAANTQFEWRDASLAIVTNNTSYQINLAHDWPTSELKAGDHLSISQPRLCVDSHDKNNAVSYCKRFEYALTGEDFKVTPDAAPIEAYKRFITDEPDYTPQISESLYQYMAAIAKMQRNASPDAFKMRIRQRSEMMMFSVESLQAIATHFSPYCPLEAQSTDKKGDDQLTTACSDFKQEFTLLWHEATSSRCEAQQCWNEALQEGVFDHDAALRTRDDIGGYLAALRQLKSEVWQKTTASLTLPSPEQASISIEWSGERSADLYEIATLRAKLDQGKSDRRIERLEKLLTLQTVAAQQSVEATILSVNNTDGLVSLTLAATISEKQALNTLINLGLIGLFGLLIVLLIIAYMLSGKPRKEKQVKSEDAWIS